MTFYHEAPEPAKLQKLLTRLGTSFALDTETALVPHCFKPGRIRTIQFHSDSATLGFDLLAFNGAHWAVLKQFLEQPQLSIYGHNIGFDYHVLWVNDVELRGQLYDSMIASTLIHNGAPNVKHNLADCVRRELGVTMDKTLQAQDWLLKALTADDIKYALTDVRLTWDLCHLLHERIGAEKLEQVYRLERCLIPALTALNHYGVPLDDDAIHAAVDEYTEATEESRIAYLETLDGRLQDEGVGSLPRHEDGSFNLRAKASGSVRLGTKQLAGYNVSSAQQTLAFWKLVGLEPVDDTGKPTTDKNVLARKQSDELARMYLAFRRVERRLSMAKKLIEHRGTDGRIHASFMPLVTGTGRFTSSNPNMQQVPRDPTFRCAIKPPAGRVLVQADYSAMELRVAAAIAGEEKMLAAFKEGADIHTRTAALMFGIEEQEVSKPQRQQAKALNFGALYGSSSGGIQNYCATLGIFMTQKAAGELLRKWHQAYPAFGKWHRECQQRADMAEPVRTMLGRRRKLFGADNRVTTHANNSTQGSAADIMKAALIEIHRKLPETAWLIAVVHDEVLVECDEADGPTVLETVLYEMREAAVPFFGERVSLDADGGVYASWGEK